MKKPLKKLLLVIIILVIAAGIGVAYYFHYKKQSKPSFHQSNQVLQNLKQGNQRFVSGQPKERDYEKQILSTKKAQYPEAVVLSCMDSRNIPELAFDQGIGKIFAIRVAGNVINQDILGSMEYGTKVVGAKLIIVMGHTNCGAMKAACKGIKLGNLTSLLQQLQPSVQTAEATLQSSDCTDATLVDAIAKRNVINMVQQIPQKSSIIAELVQQGKVKIIGAMYDVSTGKITFINSKAAAMNSNNTE